jgi:signal transduction histidine kinase
VDWIFAIHDNGIGIAAQYHLRIFEPFRRLHGSEIAGAGVGLATCKRIVERHGGRLWVESVPGDGATFFFSLPAA